MDRHAILHDWREAFAAEQPIDRLKARAQLLQDGSEFAEFQTFEAPLVAHATNGATKNMIAPSDRGLAAVRVMEREEGKIAILQEFNYWYREASGGALTEAINAGQLAFWVNKEKLPRLADFRLDHYSRGDASLRFGQLPLGIVVPSDSLFKIVFTPSGTAGGSFDLYLSLLVRFEPRDLMELAGLVPKRRG